MLRIAMQEGVLAAVSVRSLPRVPSCGVPSSAPMLRVWMGLDHCAGFVATVLCAQGIVLATLRCHRSRATSLGSSRSQRSLLGPSGCER